MSATLELVGDRSDEVELRMQEMKDGQRLGESINAGLVFHYIGAVADQLSRAIGETLDVGNVASMKVGEMKKHFNAAISDGLKYGESIEGIIDAQEKVFSLLGLDSPGVRSQSGQERAMSA